VSWYRAHRVQHSPVVDATRGELLPHHLFGKVPVGSVSGLHGCAKPSGVTRRRCGLSSRWRP
jgi:hypothetical protein